MSMPLSGQFRYIIFPTDARQRPKLINLGASPEEVTSDADPVCDLSEENASFLNWLFSQAGLDARLYCAEMLQRRLPACLRALRVRTVAQARRLLEDRPAMAATALGAMLVG